MKKNIFIISAVFFFAALFSCEDPTSVGETIIPEDDNLEVVEINFTNFIINTIADDTLYTSGSGTNYIGEYITSTFGKKVANFYSEPYYAGGFEPVTSPVVDSAKMYVQITGYQGDSTVTQTLEVFKITEAITQPNLISTSFTVGGKIAEFTDRKYEQLDTLINGESAPEHFQTVVDNAFAQTILNDFNAGTIENTEDLRNVFNGIAIKPIADGTGKGIFQINSGSATVTEMQIYYTDDEAEKQSLIIDFLPIENGEDSTLINNHFQFLTDYTLGSNTIVSQVSNYSPTGYPTNYIQGTNGVLAELDFSQIQNVIDSAHLINKAELFVYPKIAVPEDTLLLPDALTLYEAFKKDENGNKTGGMIDIIGTGLNATVQDRIYDRASTARLTKDENDNYMYRFFFPNYLQYVIEEELDPKLYLGVSNRANSISGIQFDTASDIKLLISYSKTNN